MPFGPDRRSGPPDFVGVGFEGAGAEWWFDQLLAHPDVDAPHDGLRAMHFFDPFCGRAMTGDDIADYHRAFRHRDGAVTGEWTPRYLADPWVPRLLARVAPDAKVLVLVADPIAHYRRVLAQRKGAIATASQRVMADVADRARFGLHLRRLHRHIAPEQVLVQQYERCVADPAAERDRVFALLGVRPGAAAGLPPAGPAPAQPKGAKLWPEVRAALHDTLDPEVEALETVGEDFDVRLWPNFAHLVNGREPAAA